MNLPGPSAKMLVGVKRFGQSVINEIIWLPETTLDERIRLTAGRPLGGKRLAHLAIVAARVVQEQRKNAAGKAMSDALRRLAEEALR